MARTMSRSEKKSRCGNRNRVELGTGTRAMWAIKSNRGVFSTASATAAANKRLQNRQVLPRVHGDQMHRPRSFSALARPEDVAMMLQFNYKTDTTRGSSKAALGPLPQESQPERAGLCSCLSPKGGTHQLRSKFHFITGVIPNEASPAMLGARGLQREVAGEAAG